MRIPALLLVCVGGLVALGPQSACAKIEATKGKTYRLTKEHGPWMIMVTSLWGETPDQTERAQKAADELVFELRRKGIPAYTYVQDSQIEHIKTLDRQGREQRQKYAAQRNMIGILAGNYPSIEDRTAQRTLKYIKELHPRVLDAAGYKGVENGPGPLNKAFLTLNPVLSPEEVSRKTRDPLLLRLNTGMDHSLYENKGKYTLVVASFYGNSQYFDKKLEKQPNIDQAGLEAWQVVKVLRSEPKLKSKGIEAFVFHERYRSLVTVGSFNSQDDPRIKEYIEMFRAKYRKNPETGDDVLVAEAVHLPGADGKSPLKTWALDPVPELMEVPRR